MTEWSASVFTADLSERIDVSASLIDMRGAVRHLQAGEWECNLSPAVWEPIEALWPDDPDAAPLGFAVQIPGEVLISGAVETARLERSAARTQLALTGVDEYAVLSSRVVYPQPNDLPPWTTDRSHTVTAQASTAIAELIRRHVGDLARPERSFPGLQVLDHGAGPHGTWKYRLGPLSDAVATIAAETGLAILIHRRLDAGLDVHVRATATRDIVLDEESLGESSIVLAATKATSVIAGGSGEGTARLFAIADGDTTETPTIETVLQAVSIVTHADVELVTETGDELVAVVAVTTSTVRAMSVGVARREVFSDQRNIDDLVALQRSADATRAQSSASTSMSGTLSIEAADRHTWRRHYNLGDTIMLRAYSSTWPVIVSGVTIRIDRTGLHVSPIIGSQPRHALAQLLRDVDNLAGRLNNVEVS